MPSLFHKHLHLASSLISPDFPVWAPVLVRSWLLPPSFEDDRKGSQAALHFLTKAFITSQLCKITIHLHGVFLNHTVPCILGCHVPTSLRGHSGDTEALPPPGTHTPALWPGHPEPSLDSPRRLGKIPPGSCRRRLTPRPSTLFSPASLLASHPGLSGHSERRHLLLGRRGWLWHGGEKMI